MPRQKPNILLHLAGILSSSGSKLAENIQTSVRGRAIREGNIPNPLSYEVVVYSRTAQEDPQQRRLTRQGLELVSLDANQPLLFLGFEFGPKEILIRQIQGLVRKGDNSYDHLKPLRGDVVLLNTLLNACPEMGIKTAIIEPAHKKEGYLQGKEKMAYAAGVVTPAELRERRNHLQQRYDYFALNQGFVYDQKRDLFVKDLDKIMQN